MKKQSIQKAIGKKIKRKESLDSPVSMRQTTLSESFGRGSLQTRLRPRVNVKNYKDLTSDSILLEKSISPDKRKTFVLIEKIDDKIKPKQPIYKTVNDKSIEEDKDSVYNFQFDYNDPNEKPTKNKRKKKLAKKPPTTKKKKTNPLKKNNNNNNNNDDYEVSKKIQKASKKTTEVEKPTKNIEKLEPFNKEIKNKDETKVEKDRTAVSSKDLPSVENPKENIPRVKISSIEMLTGDRKVSFAPNLSMSRKSSVKFNPFRSSQSIFKSRSTMIEKDMMDHSLLNKSLSPIKGGCVEQFDPASPWRPPLPVSFSSVRQVVQSTPQIKRNFGRITQRESRIDENEEMDENEEAKGVASPVGKIGSKKTPMPLGVRISNAENIQALNVKKKEQVFERGTITSINKLGIERKLLGLATNYGENKGNSGFADRLYKSPKKNDKPVTSSLGSPGFKKRSNIKGGDVTQDLITQRKDSGLDKDENSPPLGEEETKLFKQSNLNTFLNIDEMPESISINTSHGIFGDARSTPVVKNLTPKVQSQENMNIENCFGFEEDCNSDVIISPLKFDKKQTTPVKKMFQILKGQVLTKEKPGAARISLGEIKNTLYPRKEKVFDKVERKEDKNKNKKKKEAGNGETKKDNKAQKNDKISNKQTFDPVQFSDTFDVLSESGNGEERDKSLGTEIALFADLEPVHFTKPPRWSYAKKRERKQYWSSDEEDDDNEKDQEAPVLKKRKLVKLNKVEEKKIDEWVKSVNETFQEIDDFDLVVEKLS